MASFYMTLLHVDLNEAAKYIHTYIPDESEKTCGVCRTVGSH